MSLEIRDLVAGYSKDALVLKGVSLTAHDGKVTVVIGPNGAGKSTLLKAICGHVAAVRGEILHDGKSIMGLEPKDMPREGIGFLLQGSSVFPAMSVKENLRLGAWPIRRTRTKVRSAFDRAYSRYPALRDRQDEVAGMLSGGQQKLLELARMTMANPKTLLLDEPSVGLMPKLVDSVYEEIARLKEQDYTILMVDQNVRKSMAIADYVYVLKLGENSHCGPVAEIEGRLEDIIREWI
jgi:branched-chain amino acid transport system ATP-binding protein